MYERGAYSPNETFVGLKNFQHLLRDAQFIRSMQNMILLVVTVTLITFAFALVFAAILTREKIKGQNFFRIIFYIPNILSVVVISGIFSAIYKPENGMLNSIIGLFRNMSDPILWKGEKLVIPSIIIAMVWQAIGYYMVMYMASMSAVPISLYESANLDGAGRLTQFFQITIPLIWTNIRTTLTFFIISTINMAFLFVKAMTSGGPNGASDVALSYMYSQKDAGLYGYSMAIGVVIFLFSFACPPVSTRSPTAIRWNFKEGRRCRIPPKNLPALRKVCTSFSSILCWFCWPLPSSCRWHGCSWPPSSRMQSSTATPGHLPAGFYWQNFVNAWNGAQMGEYMLNSVIVTALALALLLVVALPAAYCLSRFHFKGCKVLNTLFMAGLFINVNYIVVPIFLMLRDGDAWLKGHFGSGFLLNNLVVLAVVYAATALPFTIYLLSGYFATLPHDFEEAAYIDGASYFPP